MSRWCLGLFASKLPLVRLAKGTARMLFSWPSSRRLPTCLDGCCFARLGHESCCCSNVSKALLHGTSSCCVGPSEPLRQRHRAHAFLEGCLQRLLTCLDGILYSSLERSVGNVRHFFWLLFRMTWTRILLLFEAFGSVFQGQSSKRFRSDSSGGIDDGLIGWACALAAQKIVFCGFQR